MESYQIFSSEKSKYCLNPYYNGRYSWRAHRNKQQPHGDVLILIIMEDTHGVLEQANERIVLQRS